MKEKRFILFFILGSLLIWGTLELNYRYGIRLSPTLTDSKLNLIQKTHNQSIEHLIFSDSVLHKTFRSYHLKENILDLSTTAGIHISGIYFMLDRLLQNNNKIKNIHIFVVPAFFSPLEKIGSWYYLWFNGAKEVKEIGRFLNLPINHFSNYVKTRFRAIDIPSHLITSFRLKRKKYIPGYKLENNPPLYSKSKSVVKIKPIVKMLDHFWDKINKLCKKQKASLNIYIEPMTKDDYIFQFQKSGLQLYFGRLLGKHPSINFIDLNKELQFSDAVFFDGHHLHHNWNKYIFEQINKRWIKLLP